MRSVRIWVVAAACVVAASTLALAQRPASRKATDAVQAAQAAMLKADEAFNQSVADKNINSFLALVADDATFGGGTPNQLRGREAIGKGWSQFFQADGPTLTWKPVKAEALAGADVGYTTGFSEHRVKGSDGKIRVSHGNYLTVWRKQTDGSWKAIFDTGTAVPDER